MKSRILKPQTGAPTKKRGLFLLEISHFTKFVLIRIKKFTEVL